MPAKHMLIAQDGSASMNTAQKNWMIVKTANG